MDPEVRYGVEAPKLQMDKITMHATRDNKDYKEDKIMPACNL
jgi:hypothetical protein